MQKKHPEKPRKSKPQPKGCCFYAMAWGICNGLGQERSNMRNKAVRAHMAGIPPRRNIPMNLQFFAEGDGAGAGEGNGSGAEGNAGEGSEEPKDVSFDDFLKTGTNQAEFDRRVQQAINTAVSKAQDKWKILTDDKVSEAEKLAKMTAAEKQQYMEQKRQKELDAREAEITKRELMATAKNTLTDKKLPLELADILVYTDAESCNASIAAVEKAFNTAVEAAVQERLKGGDPMKKAPQGNDALQKQIETAMAGGLYQ